MVAHPLNISPISEIYLGPICAKIQLIPTLTSCKTMHPAKIDMF
jgi:hypothetical protein